MEVTWDHGNKAVGTVKCWDVLASLHKWRILGNGPVQ
jgi:hypothetical protein